MLDSPDPEPEAKQRWGRAVLGQERGDLFATSGTAGMGLDFNGGKRRSVIVQSAAIIGSCMVQVEQLQAVQPSETKKVINKIENQQIKGMFLIGRRKSKSKSKSKSFNH